MRTRLLRATSQYRQALPTRCWRRSIVPCIHRKALIQAAVAHADALVHF